MVVYNLFNFIMYIALYTSYVIEPYHSVEMVMVVI